jgi:hypothetical protein
MPEIASHMAKKTETGMARFAGGLVGAGITKAAEHLGYGIPGGEYLGGALGYYLEPRIARTAHAVVGDTPMSSIRHLAAPAWNWIRPWYENDLNTGAGR